ncbi:MAG: hypothetical protein M1818_006619 [Claussenomyces sp. TS43310]|nr:MAG: hypothetical protein M1818_006946 [Claussenomyces sp. TS43310]KAI9735042.1 MAG: hypothetical protein M1818_006619 [Claussenomyces sp. TS43310]
MADNAISGRLALITGASGGIGAACARSLAAQGVNLALAYSTNLDGVLRLYRGLQTRNHELPEQQRVRLSIHQGDLTCEGNIERIIAEARQEHQAEVDILVANAGYGQRITDISDIPLSEFDLTLNINLRAPFLLTKGVVDGMKAQRWGRIIFISSIAAYGAGINGCHYAASKGGLTGMMKNLASRLAEYNISVNDVAPAMIGSTGMIPDSTSVPGVQSTIPLGRLGTPEEIANVVTMFATTGYATGQSIVVGGGLRYL